MTRIKERKSIPADSSNIQQGRQLAVFGQQELRTASLERGRVGEIAVQLDDTAGELELQRVIEAADVLWVAPQDRVRCPNSVGAPSEDAERFQMFVAHQKQPDLLGVPIQIAQFQSTQVGQDGNEVLQLRRHQRRPENLEIFQRTLPRRSTKFADVFKEFESLETALVEDERLEGRAKDEQLFESRPVHVLSFNQLQAPDGHAVTTQKVFKMNV